MVKTHNIRVWAKSCAGYFSQQPRRRFERKGRMMPYHRQSFHPRNLSVPRENSNPR